MKNIKNKILLASMSALLLSTIIVEASPQNPLLNSNRESVSFSWSIEQSFIASFAQSSSDTQESVEYWQTVSSHDLQKGIAVATTAPGALVRISELNNGKRVRGVQPLALEIQTPAGKRLSNGKAMAMNVSPQAMRNAGSPFPDGTAGFQLKSELGSGKFTLRHTGTASPNAQYTLHVFDKNSSQRLSVTREQANYKWGENLVLTGAFSDSESPQIRGKAIEEVSGFVRTPQGKQIALKIDKGSLGQFQTSLALDMEPEFGGLYEAYIDAVSMSDGVAIKRRVKTAFALVKQTASLDGVDNNSLSKGLSAKLDVIESGRYEVRGVLYGTDSNGQLRPFMASSTAQWLEPGKAQLTLSFDNNLVSNSEFGQPYEVRYLQLSDQSRMGKLDNNPQAINLDL